MADFLFNEVPRGFSLSWYIEGIAAGWPEGDVARMIVPYYLVSPR